MFTNRKPQILQFMLRFCLLIALLAGAGLPLSPHSALAGLSVPTSGADDGFNPGANGAVQALAVQSDGKILVGGGFTTLGGATRNYIARLNPDGSLDTTFDPGADAAVTSLAVQVDGKILVGGSFTTLGGQPRSHFGRLNSDGSLDATFDPGADWPVNTIVVQPDGKIVVGGWFTFLGGQVRDHIARLNPDGSLDTSFNPGADGWVYSLALQPDGKILAGGWFFWLGGVWQEHIGRLNPDGSPDAAFTSSADNVVAALAVQPDGKIVAGGFFTTLGGQARLRIGRLNPDGSLDTAFDPGADGDVNALALQPDGKILVGGAFITLGGGTRSHIGRLNPDGSLDASFNPGADAYVSALALQADGKILAGGNFTALGGQTRNYLGRLYPDDSLDATFNPSANNAIYAMALQTDGKILVGGDFWFLGGQIRNYIGRLNSNGSLDTAFNPGANGSVQTFAVQPDGKILVGGHFTTLGGNTRINLGRLNPDGTVDTFSPPVGIPGDWVNTIAVQPDGMILVGGTFSTISGITKPYLCRLYTDGILDASFIPIPDYHVFSLAIQPDGKILVGGDFSMLGGQARGRIGRLNPDGSLDTTFGNPAVNGTIHTLVLQPDGKVLIGGSFTMVGAYTRNHIARLNSDGTLDIPFNPNANGTVQALAVQADGKIVLGGGFTMLGAYARNRIARLDPYGSVDLTFDPGASDWVKSLALQPDGKILAGGNFTSLGGQPRSFIGRIANDTAALQNLSASLDGATVTWLRSGAGPEFLRVSFEQSTDGVSYTLLGEATRITGGWQLSGLSLPRNQNLWIRARGYYTTGYYNGSASILETVRNVYLPSYTLEVNGVGSGTVAKDPDQASYDFGEEVDLTAAADPGWTFAGWSGDLSGAANPATITMYSNSVVTATFTQNHYTLTVNTVGNGSVAVDPQQDDYHYGDGITLTATAEPGWSFAGWSGDLSGMTNPITFTIDDSQQVTATFTQDHYTLSVNVVGSGGSVAVNPDQATYLYGEVVTLTASVDPGWTFAGWSGDLSGAANPENLTLDISKEVTATFTQNEYTLSVWAVGSGGVTKNPDQPTYHYGDVITLTAAADTGWSFSHWAGHLNGTDNPATITIDGDKAVFAYFTEDQYTLSVNVVGGGSVAKNPDQATYLYGDVVTLTATVNPGWVFSGWSGDLSGMTNPIAITMDGDKTVTATFTQYRLYLPLTINSATASGALLLPDEQAAPGFSFAWLGLLMLISPLLRRLLSIS